MSREFSKSRTHSPSDAEPQKILNLNSSPRSSRKHSDEGADGGVQIPNFSKEVSLDSEDDILSQRTASVTKRPVSQISTHLETPVETPKSVSPKGILKRRAHEQQYNIGVSETREKTKCCHPLVNKIKHLADKTLHKLDRTESEKSPISKRKKNEDVQEIRQLKSSPGAVRRQKFSAIKLGDSDEMSKTMSIDTPPPRKKKDHIYEDIEESKYNDNESLNSNKAFDSNSNGKENHLEIDNLAERKSVASYDPSLVMEDNQGSSGNTENIMEKLHKKDNTKQKKEDLEDMDTEEPSVDDIFHEQLEGNRPANESPNITITEMTEDNLENNIEQSTTIPIESSPSPSPREFQGERNNAEMFDNEWSKPSSDHEYEIIEKPPPNIIYTAPSVEERPRIEKTDDELSSTTSLERKYLQHTSDEDEQIEEKEIDQNGDEILTAESLQKNIEERFFVNTPSTASRTECEISTSQVDSSALEQLPLQRSKRSKNSENVDKKIQQRIKEGTGKLKTQAGKLKTKIQNMKAKQFTNSEKPKFSLPERPKFKMPDRPKINFPERPKFTLPDRRKFSLPERPKFKNINLQEKFSIGDRKKFSFPNRPKFNIPDLSKLKMPERPKIHFPSLGRKKEYKVDTTVTESSSDNLQNVATVDFDAKTYPRFFNRKKKTELAKTSSSPMLNREDTPPPTFTFTRVKKSKEEPSSYIPDSPEQPREYGNIENDNGYENGHESRKQFETTYDFDKLSPEYMDEDMESSHLKESRNAASIPDMSNQEYTHINEINNDEFFVRPRGISRENIQVREYLSDEIRQAFNIPQNVLATMGSDADLHDEHRYANVAEADPELMIDENEPIQYSTEDLNDRDDGYYTFPPVRPSRAKRKKKETDSIKYIDDSVNASIQFSEIDLGLPDDQTEQPMEINGSQEILETSNHFPELTRPTDLRSIHEYANDDVIEYPDNIPVHSQTLPMPPKRKKKFFKKDLKHSSLNDFKSMTPTELWEEHDEQPDDIVVYRTEHEYIVPMTEPTVTEQSPVAPRRNRSRSSRGTSLCDDDRTSHGAESLILDTQSPATGDVNIFRDIRQESPGYATVDKGPYAPSKGVRRSKSKTPPARRRKSNSSERKYYTVGPAKSPMPDRPPRKKSSTSLMTLDSFTKRSISGDITQYVEIEEPQFEETHKDLISGEVVKKMKDRPLPPPPRPPRGPKRKKRFGDESLEHISNDLVTPCESYNQLAESSVRADDVVEIEVSTQTDPLPDDIDYEFCLDENLDISMSSSLRDIIDEDSIMGRSKRKVSDSPHVSRTTSRSEKSLKLSDPKISELSKLNIDRSSPTVILVEKRVSSPTKINEREEMLTEASLTVQHIDVDESTVPQVPPLPKSKSLISTTTDTKRAVPANDEQSLEKVSSEGSKEVQLDNLVTQRLQVKDLDVGKLNVSELQASKILVSDIEGMTLQVSELDSKSGHISVSGIEFSQSVIDEIVKKFAEISTTNIPTTTRSSEVLDLPRPMSREEHTQTDEMQPEEKIVEVKTEQITEVSESQTAGLLPSPGPSSMDDTALPPQRPPPPDLGPLLYSYLQDFAIPSPVYPRARPLDYQEPQHQTPPPPARRVKRKPAALPATESSSDEVQMKRRPSPRPMPLPVKPHEPTVTESGAQFLRACHNSITRTIRNIFNTFMSYIHGHEDKKDMQMALVIFLVLIAGLIMFGLSDGRTVHHHHWEFFNPPDGNQ
ncbi:PREDICTED: uncharacterized protein LOC106113771 isoform X2 [Papilio xuthus]|nr:PREDICTED: uncharacterized protein LOC106113771 isoform X2 [Papilio xuthus]